MNRLSSWAWHQEPDGVLSKLILSYICHSLDIGFSNISLQDLCDLTEASAEQVRAVLDDLRREGLISFDRSSGGQLAITVNAKFNVTLVEDQPEGRSE